MEHVTTPTNAAPISHTEALGDHRPASLRGPTARLTGLDPVLSLARRVEQLLGEEDAADEAGNRSDCNAITDEREALEAQAAQLQATTLAGAAAQLAMAFHQVELVRGHMDLDRRNHHHSIAQDLLKSVARLLAPHISPAMWSGYVGGEQPGWEPDGETTSAHDSKADDRCEAAQVWRELQSFLDAELDAEAKGDGAMQEICAEQRDRLEHKLATVQATSPEGALAQLLVGIDFAEMIRGNSGDQATCDRYHDLIEAMSKSAFRVLGAKLSDQVWSCYIGGARTAPTLAVSTAATSSPLTALLDESDRYFNEAGGCRSDTPEERALDAKAEALNRQFLRAPINSHADAIAKLRWLNRANYGGQTGNESAVVAQLVAYLGGDPVAVLTSEPHDECATVADLTLAFDRARVSEPALLHAAE